MRLCIATSSYPSRGESSFAGVFVRDFAKALARRGIKISIFTQDTGRPPLRDDGIEFITFPWAGKAKPLSNLKPYRPDDVLHMLLLLHRGSKRLVAHCLEANVDFLLAMWAVPAGYWAMSVRKQRGIPFAVWSLGSDIWIYGRLPVFKLWIQRILRQSTCCFADGFSLAEEVRSLSGRSCSFLPTTRRLPTEGLPKVAFDPERSHYVFMGRYHSNKGPDILVEAIGLIDRRTLSRIQFHFFGAGPLEEDLRRRVSAYGLGDSVIIQGPVDESTVSAILARCDGLIIPSRVESIPVILSDALQRDCPLVVTDVKDMGSLVRSYQAGMVADPSPESLKEAIVNHVGREKDDFKEGRKKLYRLFDLEESVDLFLKGIGSGTEGKWPDTVAV